MKIPIKDGKAAKVGEIELPAQFTEPVREDLIAKVFKALATNGRMAYGADVRAGMKYAATLSRRRRKYRGSYGLGISRVPRKILSRRGTRFNWVGAELLVRSVDDGLMPLLPTKFGRQRSTRKRIVKQ